jgi:hypothetical protein
MFAPVVTAQAGAMGFDDIIRLAQQQLPGARQQPGFKGFYLLTNAETGKVMTISLWDIRGQMEAVAGGGRPGPGRARDGANAAAAPDLRSRDASLTRRPPARALPSAVSSRGQLPRTNRQMRSNRAHGQAIAPGSRAFDPGGGTRVRPPD